MPQPVQANPSRILVAPAQTVKLGMKAREFSRCNDFELGN
jgi:hypothetical protein